MHVRRRCARPLAGIIIAAACLGYGAAWAPVASASAAPPAATSAADASPSPQSTRPAAQQPNGQVRASAARTAARPAASAESTHNNQRTPLPMPPEQAPTRPGGTSGPAGTVYLTFDDGPSAGYTPQVLDLLAQYHAQATFFMIGSQAQAQPGLVARVRAAGHVIGNHTYSHPWLTTLATPAIGTQISSTSAVLGGTKCLRPPGGYVDARVRSVAAGLGQNVVLWTVDPQDWSRPGTAAITNTVLAKTRAGSIVLMHDGGGDRSQSVAALRTILATLAARGYGFQALPQCA